ncbi:Pycsar system effector family protein [Novosphingobium sp. B 225]|uniref:Pycsar system effector family protein n=1 Tax=Novosphingobium sp. B 225 TaxID=1961849 RepID=UPI000B4A5AC3|nr:Pycsar system effector family protein [Novosphingobium sp. B 225]
MGENAASSEPQAYTRDAIYLVRTVTQVNLQLSQMADQKASILMGAAFVVFTITVGQASKGTLPLSLLVLALSAFCAVFCSVAAIMPTVKPPPLIPGQENRLFFGVFTQWSEEEFAERILSALHRDEDVFRVMIRDIYQNGQVLQRKKYRYLGLAYRIFLGGLALTLLIFLWEHRPV